MILINLSMNAEIEVMETIITIELDISEWNENSSTDTQNMF